MVPQNTRQSQKVVAPPFWNSLTLLAIATTVVVCVVSYPSYPSAQTTIPPLNNTVTYVMPLFGSGNFATEVTNLRTRLGEGPLVKVGFTLIVSVPMSDYNVNLAKTAAIRTNLASTFAQIESAVASGKANNVPIAISLISSIRNRVDGAKAAALADDRRNHQWYSGSTDGTTVPENSVATNWWGQSQYARKQQAVRQAYIREVGKYLAAKMVAEPNTLIAVTGDGEIEMSSEKWTDQGVGNPPNWSWADYSPFAVLEFQDWLRCTGMYATGQPLAGQGYTNCARYTSDPSPAIDGNGDGKTLNGDFGTSFTTWSLKHFPWSLSDDPNNDPNKVSVSSFPAGSAAAPNNNPTGFDPPRTCPFATAPLRVCTTTSAWWNAFNLFRMEMIWRSNKDFAKWITTSADPVTGATIPSDRFYSEQVPTDFLFGNPPADGGVRLTTSGSPWWTADVSPYGGIGITAYNVYNFDGLGVPTTYKTLANVAPVLSQRNVRYGLIEWHPADPALGRPGGTPPLPPPDVSFFRAEMAIIDKYRPHIMMPFIWGAASLPGFEQWQVEGTGFETALKEWIAANKDEKPVSHSVGFDTPTAPVKQPFTLTGFALDLGMPQGVGWPTGVDQVTITATQVSGNVTATFPASYGLPRPGTVQTAPTVSGNSSATTVGVATASGFSRSISGLPAGSWKFSAAVRSTRTNAIQTSLGEITLAVDQRTLVTDKSTFHFNKTQGTNQTAQQSTPFLMSGSGAFTWTAGGHASWLQVSPTSGSGAGTLTFQLNNADSALQSIGTKSTTVTLSSPQAGNSVTITVTATVVAAPAPTGPFGQVDTPLQNSTDVVGAIGVTGWALDDGGVESVKIYRNCLTNIDSPAACTSILGRSLVYIGDAGFISGARPDVETECPTCPQKERAGWGYLMLTSMLPNVTSGLGFGGQGSLLIYAIARDFDGNRTLLGRNRNDSSPTSIAMANASISKPFGAIDTPSQGQFVTGSLANFGWALTADSNDTADATDILIPTDGSTMTVVIDGVAVGTVVYNQCRGTNGNPVPAGQFCNDDVANIFGNPTPKEPFTVRSSNPTRYRNLDAGRAAIGSFDIDTNFLANGSHSIAWGVTDSQGRAEGIGSRNFFVLNGGSLMAEDALLNAPAMARGAASALFALTPASRAVTGRTGFDFKAPLERIEAGGDGIRRVQIPEVGRLELQLGAVDRGYLVANGELRDLPPGSRLDPSTGEFTWNPHVAYVGTYRLVFIDDNEIVTVDVGIHPAANASGQSEIRMFLDLPQTGQLLDGDVHVGGWAFDPKAAIGTGIGAVHVWAARIDSTADAKFLGEAELGVARPDIGESFGGQFATAGFDMTARLESGRWSLTAYVWNRRTARWEDARTVTITVR